MTVSYMLMADLEHAMESPRGSTLSRTVFQDERLILRMSD